MKHHNPTTPKIIFFDIDDTLYIKHQNYVPDSVATALKSVKEKGIIVAIATGRGRAVFPKAIYDLITDVGIDLVISINGQCSHHKGELLSHYPLTESQISEVTEHLVRQNLAYAYMTDDGILAMAEDDALIEALSSLHIPYTLMSLADFDKNQAVYQVLAFHPDNQSLQLQMPESLKTVRWHKSGIDILDVHGSKARGIEQALKALGLTFADTWAFGDGLNDIEMLEKVGFGVAMGNAHADLKAVADYVCPNAWDDGIYQGLKELGLIDD